MAAPVDSYSLRRLSPFSGTTRILQRPPLRAISNDGLTWRLHIQTTPDNSDASKRPVLFGLWQRTSGLKTFPVHPHQASPQVLQLAHDFATRLPGWLAQCRFPLRDSVECWLLDPTQQPLALLQACAPGETLPSMHQAVWLPCAPDDHTFSSPHIQQIDPIQQDRDTPPISHRDVIAQQVNGAAGRYPIRQWFQRQIDGSGIALSDRAGSQTPSDRHLPAAAFPHYLLKQVWRDPDEQHRIDDFFHWQAPWLLTLPDLSDTERRQLETHACDYPRRLHALYHLYPKLLQTALIQDTLIRARLEKTLPPMAQ